MNAAHALRDVTDVVDDFDGHRRTVVQYAAITKQLVDAAKHPGFAAESWAPLAALVDVDRFVRVGNFKEVMNWGEYLTFMTNWAPTAEWSGAFKRVSEVDGLVFLELEERSRMGEFESVVNSISVYEFSADDRIRRIDLYLQMELPAPEMLTGYEGVDIST